MGAERQGSDLNSGDATTIFASCGSSGNSAIVLPTCRRAEEHGGQLELCGGGLGNHILGGWWTQGRGDCGCLERVGVCPKGQFSCVTKGRHRCSLLHRDLAKRTGPCRESNRGRGYGEAFVGKGGVHLRHIAIVVQGAEVVEQLQGTHQRLRSRRVHEVKVHLQRVVYGDQARLAEEGR